MIFVRYNAQLDRHVCNYYKIFILAYGILVTLQAHHFLLQFSTISHTLFLVRFGTFHFT